MKEKAIVSATVFLLVFVAMAPMVHADPVTSLNPIADALVQWTTADADSNFGLGDHVAVRSDKGVIGGVVLRSYLKFAVTAITGTISKAVLNLFCSDFYYSAGLLNVEAHKTTDNWIESGVGGITWNNQPGVGALITTTAVDGTGKWYAWDITAYVVTEYAGDKIVSVVMTLPNDFPPWDTVFVNGREFPSKETTTAFKPVLEITYTLPTLVPEFGVNVAIITSIATALMFTLKRLRK